VEKSKWILGPTFAEAILNMHESSSFLISASVQSDLLPIIMPIADF